MSHLWRHESSILIHSIDSLLVERLPGAALEVVEAPVSGELSSNTKVPIQRPHGVRHPTALAVLHLDCGGHGF